MATQNVIGATLLTLGLLLLPAPAAACGCAGTPTTPAAVRASDLVFLGTVAAVEYSPTPFHTNPDGSVTGPAAGPSTTARFTVVRTFHGIASPAVAIRSAGTTCDFLFKRGETWLIYAQVREGVTTTHKCARTRLQAEAAQDLKYLEGLQRGEKLGIVAGVVLRKTTTAGETVLKAIDDPLQIVAVVDGQRVVTSPDRWGPYQIVLPPGEAQLFVERDGVSVSPSISVRITEGGVVSLQLIAAYEKH